MNLININKLRQAFDTAILALPKNTTFTSNEAEMFLTEIFNNETNDFSTSTKNYDLALEVYYDYQAVLSMHPYKSIN